MIDWDTKTKEVANLCGIYEDGDIYRSGIMDDLKVISHKDLKDGLRDIFSKYDDEL